MLEHLKQWFILLGTLQQSFSATVDLGRWFLTSRERFKVVRTAWSIIALLWTRFFDCIIIHSLPTCSVACYKSSSIQHLLLLLLTACCDSFITCSCDFWPCISIHSPPASNVAGFRSLFTHHLLMLLLLLIMYYHLFFTCCWLCSIC